MKKRTNSIYLVIVIIICGWIFKDNIIRSYVSVCHNKLESYAEQMLDSTISTSGKYGLWKTSAYPQHDVVEFSTGSNGLVPSSTYKGFYYSADNEHKVFSVADSASTTLNISDDYATWTDDTDNHGSSTRILDKWFWFEASF
ncbi:MAG: hypothetical protein E7492_05400 [Ruminococcaceae bacterium]|nr:hypothetical protein [Oscillospiraceae bacterium]